MSNDYPQGLRADPVYVKSGGESALAKNLEQVIRDDLVDDPDDLGVHEPLFATMISRDVSHQEFTVYSQGVVAHSDETTHAFRLASKGEDLVQKWGADLMSEGASTFTGERGTLDESSSKPSGGTKMLYNYWGTKQMYWQDTVDGIEAPPIVYDTHHAVRKTLEEPMRAAADSPEETGWTKTDTTVAEDISVEETQYPLGPATSI